MSRYLLGVVLCLSFALVGTFPHDAMAKTKKGKKTQAPDVKNQLIIKALGPLKWGMTKDEVVNTLREEEMSVARQDDSLRRDRLQMQQAMKRIRDHSKRFSDTYTPLGKKTNLDVSVIGDEFIKDNNEAYLRIVDSRSQRYYFFYRDHLYKYVVAYNKSYLENVDFEGFIAATIAKYGRPTEAFYDDESEPDTITSVEWQTKDVILILKNKQRFFGTYTMTFANPKIYSSWQKIKEVKDRMNDSSAKVTSEVKSLLQTGDVTSSGAAVASLVGSTKVDLAAVMPVHKEEDEEAAAAEEAKKKKEAEEKKKKKAAKKKKAKRRKSKVDFSDLNAKSGEGLIIY